MFEVEIKYFGSSEKWQQSTRFARRHFSLSKKSRLVFSFSQTRQTSLKFLHFFFFFNFLSCGSTCLRLCLARPLCVPASPPCSQTMCSSALCVAVPTPPFRRGPDKRATVSNEKNCRCTFPSAALPHSLPFYHVHAHTRACTHAHIQY